MALSEGEQAICERLDKLVNLLQGFYPDQDLAESIKADGAVMAIKKL